MDLGVSLELIHLSRNQVQQCFDQGLCDIAMSAYPIRLEDLGRMYFTSPYLKMRSALIVKDFQKKSFQNVEKIGRMEKLRIAVTPQNSFAERKLLRRYFPQAELVELGNVKSFFLENDVADALLTTDIIGKTWALLYPAYGVVVPEPYLSVYNIAYPIPETQGALEFLKYLNDWLLLQEANGERQRQYEYWISGETPERHRPRWSIIRNVLHWVD